MTVINYTEYVNNWFERGLLAGRFPTVI